MFIDTYQHPYELQRDDAALGENQAPDGRDGNGPREEMFVPMSLFDEAGRIPYEDIN